MSNGVEVFKGFSFGFWKVVAIIRVRFSSEIRIKQHGGQ